MKYKNHIEPFAVGFLEADVSKIDNSDMEMEYRIACGFDRYAKEIPLTINDDDVFVTFPIREQNHAVHFEFGSGLCVNGDILNREIAENPEFASELTEIRDIMLPMHADSNTWGSFNQHELKINETGLGWGGTWGGHSNPGYGMYLTLGTNGLRDRIETFRKINLGNDTFYDSLSLAISSLDTLAKRYHDLALKKAENTTDDNIKSRMLRIADAFTNVPMNEPRDFFEACLSFWLYFTYDGIDSPGRFDQYMIKYYLLSSPEDRKHCLEALWELFHNTRTWNLCLSGSDEFWNDETNILTYDILALAREKKYQTPNITLRVHKNTPDELWHSAAETLATGIGMPSIYSDHCVCPALESLGIPASDSHLYCMNGCNQIDIIGKSHMGLEDGEVNLAKCLEITLNHGKCSITGDELGLDFADIAEYESFEGILSAYKKQVEYVTDCVIKMANQCQKIFFECSPNPLRSNMIQGCVEKAMDYKGHGPIYNHGQILTEGIADTVDSLYAIKHLIFEEKKYTLSELISALRHNYEGEEYSEIYSDFKNCAKFGNDNEDVDCLYADILTHFNTHLRTKRTWRGGIYGGGCSPFSRAAGYGIRTGALPNGKKMGESMFADSLGSVPGCDTCGPTALLNSVLNSNQRLATSGNVMQVKFSKNQFASEKGIETFIMLAKTYFELGGQNLSVNVVSKEELLDAMVHPECHRNLIVRVGGYSDYFNNLSQGLKENVIARSELNL